MQNLLALKNNTVKEVGSGLKGTETHFKDEGKHIAHAPLNIRFQVETRYLEAVWQRGVNNEEYRQGIRFLGLCIAILRAEHLLVDFTELGNPTTENQQSTADYLQRAMQVGTLKKCAWVLAPIAAQQQIYEAVVHQIPKQPFLFNNFYCTVEAKAWLLESVPQAGQPILIPTHCSLKELRRFATTEISKQTIDGEATDKPTITCCKTDFMEILIDRQKSFIKLRWLRRVTSREYRYGILKTGRALLQNKLHKLMIHNQQLGTLTLEDQAWLVNISLGIFSKSKLKLFAVVMSPDAMQQLASESIRTRLTKANLPHRSSYFLSEAEAMGWLQSPDNE